jgi:[ribosomal protein S18]-alanine N-acetyltransferase
MSTVDVALRLACANDARVMAAMSRDLIEGGLGWSYHSERIRRLIAEREVASVVADRNGQLAGFGIMRFGDERARLILLAVQPAWRRVGIARRMLHWLAESAAAAGTASIHVELRAGNTAARDLYEAAGFSETFRVPGYYQGREAAVRMVRVLRAPGVVVPAWQPPAG